MDRRPVDGATRACPTGVGRAAIPASAALLVAILIPTGAGAAEVKIPGARTAWFWDSAEKVTTCTDDGVQNVCGDISPSKGVFGNAPGSTPITQGHLGIGVKDGGSDMRAYTKFDTSTIPFGAQIESFIATFTVSRVDEEHTQEHAAVGGKVPATFNDSGVVIQVCAVAAPWGSSEGDPPSSTTIVRPHPDQPDGNTQPEITTTRAEPNVNCGLSTTAKFSDDGKTLGMDITEIAKAWAAGELNEGIALLPVIQGVSPNWTVELHGLETTSQAADGSKITFVTKQEAMFAAVSYTEAAIPPPPPPPEVDQPQFPSFGNPVPVDPGPAPPQEFGDTTPPPVVAQPNVPVGRAAMDTPAWFFGLIPVMLLLLGFVSNLIGPDPIEPQAVGAENRVASVLQERRLDDL